MVWQSLVFVCLLVVYHDGALFSSAWESLQVPHDWICLSDSEMFMFTGYLIVLLLMPCSIFTFIDWLTSRYWAPVSCRDCSVCERQRKWMLKHAASQSGLVMKSSSGPDSLSQAQAHLLKGSVSLIHSIHPSTSYFPSFCTHIPTFRQSALLLLQLIVLGVFNLSLLSACRVQYLSPLSPASFSLVLLSFIASFHSGWTCV